MECEFPPRTEHDFSHLRRKRMTTANGLVCLEDYPYTVSIRLHLKHWCGGAIVSNSWILTAAQCFDYVATEEITVRLGSVFRDYGGQIYGITEYRLHPDYRIDSYYPEYNLAMVQTNTKIVENNRARPVPLPFPFSEVPASFGELVVTGYGSVLNGQIHEGENQELRRMIVKNYAKSECRLSYGSDYYLQEDHMCLDSMVAGVALCSGDTGNPAVHFNGINREGVLYGIAVFSGDEECTSKTRPGVYSKVSYSKKWIDSVISSKEKSRDLYGNSEDISQDNGARDGNTARDGNAATNENAASNENAVNTDDDDS